MADEKKPKKKKPTDSAAAGSGGIPVAPPRPPLDDVDSHEYAAMLRGAPKGAEGEAQQQQEPPEKTFWQRLWSGAQGSGDVMDAPRAVVRGVANMVNEVDVSMVKAANALTGSDRVDPKQAQTEGRAKIDRVLGKRSDDPIVGFVESASQALSGFTIARGAGLGNMAAGAASDMFAFDPYEASIAEMAARAPKWSGLHELGNLLSVDGDDSETVARLKRGAEGMLAGKTLDGLVAAVRSIRARKAAVTAKDPAEKAALEVKADQEAAKAQAYHEGTLGTTEPVVARPAADGDGWELVNVQSLRRKAAEKMDPTLAEELRIAKEEAVTDHMTGVPNRRALDAALARAEADPNLSIVVFDANNFKHVNKLMGDDAGDVAIKDVAAAIRQAAEEAGVSVRSVFRRGGDEFTVIAPNDIADKVKTRAEEIYGSRKYGETEVSLTGSVGENYRAAGAPLQAAKAARKAGVAPSPSAASDGAPGSTAGPPLKVKDAAEAQVLAAEMNHGLAHREAADRGLLNDDPTAVLAKFKELAENNDLEGIRALVEESGHFNPSYMAGEKGTAAAVETMSRMFGDVIDEAQARGQNVEEMIVAIREAMGLLTPEQAHTILVGNLKGQKAQSLKNLAADVYMKLRGKELAKIAARMDARPHDNILLEEFREGYLKLLEAQKALAAANSEWGLTGRLMQERNNPLLDGITLKMDEAKAKEVASAKEEIAAVRKELSEATKAPKKGKPDKAKIGPNTETVVDAAELVGEKKAAGTAEPKDIEKQGLDDGTRDTEGVTATDFQFARARDKAVAAMRRLQAVARQVSVDPDVKADNRSLRGERVKMQGDAQRADPLEIPEVPKGTGPINPIEELSKWIDAAESELDKALAPKPPRPGKQRGPKERPDVSPIETHIAQAKWLESLPTYVAGMKPRELRTVAAMVRLADGKPRNLYAVAHSARVIQETGFTKGALELFINNILSGAKTALTAGISGALVTGLDVAGKIGGGLARRDMAQAREGYDLGISLIGEVNDSLKGMVAAIKLGRSVINPLPRHIVIGGITGELVRGQGRMLIGADEFVVVSNYRARVRAKSLRMGRADGLEGEALMARVERDLEAAYDKDTGMATLSEPLEAGDRAAMRTPLGDDTHGGKLHNYVSGEDWAKWVAPFVRTSVNLWRTGVETTPVLNLLYKKNREIMARGGPEAAELHARSAIAGTVYAAMFMYGKDNVTGRGPSDPELRKLWRGKDGRSHQPYSIRVGGKWISYRRGDPLGMMIGLTADLRTMIHEIGNDAPEVGEFAVAIVASITSALSSKTHMSGITLATDAFSSGDGASVTRWLSGIASGLAVPSAIAQFNDDGTMREVQNIGDAIINRIPGWSKTLDPRFNMFGEPELKAAGTMNRNVNPFTFVDAGKSVEDDLFLLGKGFSSPSRTETIGGVKVDFGDRQKWDNGSGKSPYVRWMELIRDQDLRSDMEKLVRSERWKRPSGTDENPGGRRWDMASGIKERAYQKALAKVLREYPLLKDHRKMLIKRDAAAYRGGEARVEQFDANQALKSLGN